MLIICIDRTKHPEGSTVNSDFLSKQKYNKHIWLKKILHSQILQEMVQCYAMLEICKYQSHS